MSRKRKPFNRKFKTTGVQEEDLRDLSIRVDYKEYHTVFKFDTERQRWVGDLGTHKILSDTMETLFVDFRDAVEEHLN